MARRCKVWDHDLSGIESGEHYSIYTCSKCWCMITIYDKDIEDQPDITLETDSHRMDSPLREGKYTYD